MRGSGGEQQLKTLRIWVLVSPAHVQPLTRASWLLHRAIRAAYPMAALSTEQLRSSKLTGVDPPREMAQAFAFASSNSRTDRKERNILSKHAITIPNTAINPRNAIPQLTEQSPPSPCQTECKSFVASEARANGVQWSELRHATAGQRACSKREQSPDGHTHPSSTTNHRTSVLSTDRMAALRRMRHAARSAVSPSCHVIMP